MMPRGKINKNNFREILFVSFTLMHEKNVNHAHPNWHSARTLYAWKWVICTSTNKSQIIVSTGGSQQRENADIMVFKVTKCGCLAGNGHMLDTQGAVRVWISIRLAVCGVARSLGSPWGLKVSLHNVEFSFPAQSVCERVRVRQLVKMSSCPQLLDLRVIIVI